MSFKIVDDNEKNVLFEKGPFNVAYWKSKQSDQCCHFCNGNTTKMITYKGVVFCNSCFKEFMGIGREIKQLSSPNARVYRGIKTRPGFFRQDKLIIDDSLDCYKDFLDNLSSEDVVLDLGANIGDFSILAARKVKKVVAYDADESLVEWDSKNQTAPNLSYVWSAIVGTNDEEVEFNLSQWTSSNTMMHNFKTFKTVKVPAVNFTDLINEIKPTALKVDIEGVEWGFDWNLPDTINLLAIEIHYNDDTNTRDNDKLTPILIKQFPQVLLDRDFIRDASKAAGDTKVVGRNLVLARKNFKLSKVSKT